MKKLQLRLFGAFDARWSDGTPVSIAGTKQRALLAMLASARNGRHSREWLQQQLWSFGDREQGRVNLRRALFETRKSLGHNADRVIASSYSDIWVLQDRIEIVGDRRDGEFLEGLHIEERGFQSWLAKQRNHGLGPAEPSGERRVTQEADLLTLTPTLAVLPLRFVGLGSELEAIGDLISMEITRTLSRSSLLNVVSHLSSREIGSSQIAMDDVRRTLNADFLVYGSVKNTRGGLIIDVDLADVVDGNIKRTWQYPIQLEAIFANACEEIYDVCAEIGFCLSKSALELASTKALPDLKSHEIYLGAISGMHADRLSQFSNARKGLEYLIEDRGISDSRLHSWLAHWYMLAIPQGWAKDPAIEVRRALECVSRALDINPNCSFSLAMSGMVNSSPGLDFADAFALLSAARIQNANNAFAWILQSRLHSFNGDGQKAVDHARHALKLSPVGPQAYFFENIAATAHVVNNDFEKALALIDRSISRNRHHRSSLRVKAVAHERSGDMRGARETVEKLRILDPDLTVDRYLRSHPAGDLETGMDWAQSLARAGIPLD